MELEGELGKSQEINLEKLRKSQEINLEDVQH